MSRSVCLLLTCLFPLVALHADEEPQPARLKPALLSAFKLRSIGPALMSGRIADLAVDPDNENIWYVAAGSGGLWKTQNSGTTWKPIFDKYGAYSIGCVTIDPHNRHVVWVGTGEAVGGRHVGFGDGVYVSRDGGGTFKNVGLKESEHIAKIVVDPKNANTIYVAAQGPLWSPAGERGLYRSQDGGETWKAGTDQRRVHRLYGRRCGSSEPQGGVCRDAPTPSDGLVPAQWRPGIGNLQIGRWR